MYILDASALLAVLLDEAGAEIVTKAIENGATISSVNLSEVAGRLALNGMPEDATRQIVAELPLTVIPADTEIAVLAALMLPATRQFGLSLGDRVCLALARQLNAVAVTADHVWEQAGPITGVTVKLIR